MLPTFLIPGAQKAGTTALRIYLAQHPDIFMADEEIHFFDRDERFKRGVEWYESNFDGWDGETAIGEKTPQYLYNEEAPARIHEMLGDVKLIFLFRNPVDRAYSHYWHEVRRGNESRGFEKAVSEEGNKFLERGKYSLFLRRFAEYFSKKRMLFLLAEELRKDRTSTLRVILEFLDVDATFQFRDLEEKHVGGVPRSRLIARLTTTRMVRKCGFLHEALLWLNTNKGKKPPMESETRAFLLNYFEKYNQDLEKFTDLDLDAWRK